MQISAPPTGWATTTSTGIRTAPQPVSGPPTSPISPAGIGASSPPAPSSVPGRVSTALRASAATLDASETALAQDKATQGPARLGLNVMTYSGFAVLAALVQVPMLLLMGNSDGIGLVAIPCALALPVVSFGLAWLTIGALAPKGSARTPLLGAVISLLALVPLVVLLAGLAMTGF